MRVGLVARADNTGLGTQTQEFARHMHPAKVLVVDICQLSPKRLKLYPDRFPNALVSTGFPDAPILDLFLEDLDVVYTAETPYNFMLFDMARERGVKTVLHMNPEFNDYHFHKDLPRPDVFALPSLWLAGYMPDPKVPLPVPVALDRFPEPISERGDGLVNFLHSIGTPAVHDRAGTTSLLLALRHVTKPVKVTIRCQEMDHVLALFKAVGTQDIPNVTLDLDPHCPENYWELYKPEYDVLLHPRRYGGLSLPSHEALAAGLPVIMTNVSPNTDLLPGDWLVPVSIKGEIMAKMPVPVCSAVPAQLAKMIDKFADDPKYLVQQKIRARAYAELLGWDAIKPVYDKLFEDLVKGKELICL